MTTLFECGLLLCFVLKLLLVSVSIETLVKGCVIEKDKRLHHLCVRIRQFQRIHSSISQALSQAIFNQFASHIDQAVVVNPVDQSSLLRSQTKIFIVDVTSFAQQGHCTRL
jgi:hypothetical protein